MNEIIPWNLILAHLRRETTPDEDACFSEWLEQGDHRALFEQLETVWMGVQQQAGDCQPDLEQAWKKFTERAGWEQETVTMSKPKPRFQLFLRRNISRVAIVAVVLLTTVVGASYWWHHAGVLSGDVVYSSANAKSHVILPDSTEVWLRHHSTMTYHYNRIKNRREVTLVGEAYFDVQPDADKAFVVTTSRGVDVTVHGTQFNVDAVHADVSVSLFEGSVEMDAGGMAVLLKPGEEGRFDSASQAISVSECDVDYTRLWMTDEIRFENKNLRDVCHDLSKWYGVSIYVAPEIGNDQSYTFTFKGEPLGEIIDVLTGIHSFKYTISENNNVVSIKKGGQ